MKYLLVLLLAFSALAQPAKPEMTLPRIHEPIVVDGDLSDSAWKSAAVIDTWWEYYKSDNGPAPVPTTAYVAYDNRYFYVGVDCRDPDPSKIRAPYVDRDKVFGDQDNIAVFIDARGEGKVALQLRTNPRGIQADAVNNDATGSEDFSPDFFYDTAAKITATGWTAEFRIPLSTLRYKESDPKTFGIIIIRTWPRDFRYSMSSSKLPRGANCFICQSLKLTGITELPSTQHLVVAPYVRVEQAAHPRGDLGSSLTNDPLNKDVGGDVKWSPTSDTTLDATINPDFSQIEADVAQIATNQRFALFFPEKRPFFLEGSDLFETPIQAVYTRTITSPRWGVRATGKAGATEWTLLAADDRGGGFVILPNPLGSDLAAQDFKSLAIIGRARHEIGRSAVGFLVTGREYDRGIGHNNVAGPDFEWRPNEVDQVVGQLLISNTKTHIGTGASGEHESSHALRLNWNHSRHDYNWFVVAQDFGDHFRADNGFVPQNGFRELLGGATRLWYPQKGRFTQYQLYYNADYVTDQHGERIVQDSWLGAFVAGVHNLASIFELHPDTKIRTDAGDFIGETYLHYVITMNPGRRWPNFSLTGDVGEAIDFANSRPARGITVNLGSTFRPVDRLQTELTLNHQVLDVRGTADPGRLFNANVSRVKATYSFTSKSLLRVIGQYVETTREPRRYLFPVARHSGSSLASILYSYKLNWQTVLFAGYGDDRVLTPDADLVRADRAFFVKVSYALQR